MSPFSYTKVQMQQFALRKERMRRLRDQGWTLQRIGEKYGISRARVGQLLNGKQA